MNDQWAQVTLGSCYEHIVQRSEAPQLPPETRYFGMEHLQSDSPTTGIGATTASVAGQVTHFQSGDTLFGRLRPYLRKVSFATTDGVCSPEVFVLRPQADRVLPRFLHLLASSEQVIGAAVAASAGSRMPRTSARDLGAIEVSLPPLVVQRRIVDLMEHLDTHLANLETEREALDALWWGSVEELIRDVDGLPTIQLGTVAEISGGLTKNKNTRLRGEARTVPYLRVANVHRRYLDLSDLAEITTDSQTLERLRLRRGDVLLNEGGDKDKLGRGAVWNAEVDDCIHQNHVFRARVDSTAYLPEFVSAWANSYGQRWFLEYGTQTTGIASVSKSTLSRFPLPDIPLATQARWADALGAVFDQVGAVERETDRLRSVRALLLAQLIGGTSEIPASYDALLAVS